MSSAKDIIIKPIKSSVANRKCKELHYSGTHTQNSQLHFGVFLNGILEGVMQLGPPIDRRKVLPLVKDTLWHEMIELNRMAFSDNLPKFSESRAISVVFKMIKKHYPQIKWILSFSDATQCGDGTIYRASGFDLIGIKKNTSMLLMPDGSVKADKTLNDHPSKKSGWWKKNGAKPLIGYQLRYIYFIDKDYKKNLSVPVLPFSDIDKIGAGMYKGVPTTLQSRRVTKANSDDQLESGGAIPTNTLQSFEVQ